MRIAKSGFGVGLECGKVGHSHIGSFSFDSELSESLLSIREKKKLDIRFER